jgi:predicted Zn-dependent protease
MSNSLANLTFLAVALAPLVTAQHQSMPPGMSHEEHLKQMSQESEMKKRGNLAMGFDQDKVSHHFHLTRAGGSIEVGVKQNADEVSLKQIRDHLRTISQEFADGVFTSPIATHAEVPPGVSVLRQRKARITYAYEETPGGARVIVSTTDRTSRTAVHDFLKYQIREHATGDPVSVQK